MEPSGRSNLRHYAHVLSQQKWIVIQVTMVAPAVAILLSLWQEPRYEASAGVLLSRQNLATSLAGARDLTSGLDAACQAETQAGLARVPEVADRTVAAANVAELSGEDLLESSMVTSALDAEGKSTTISNLAVSIARGGRHVTLVDLDLRRPSIARLFGLQGRAGLTDVALGRTSLEDALTSVAVGENRMEAWNGGDSDNGGALDRNNQRSRSCPRARCLPTRGSSSRRRRSPTS